MAGEGIVPPQGMNVINEKRTIYGLPLAVPCGSAGTKIVIKQSPKAQSGAGVKLTIISGTFTPTIFPPTESGAVRQNRSGSGTAIQVVNPTKPQNGGGLRIIVVTPVLCTMGGGMKAVKI